MRIFCANLNNLMQTKLCHKDALHSDVTSELEFDHYDIICWFVNFVLVLYLFLSFWHIS